MNFPQEKTMPQPHLAINNHLIAEDVRHLNQQPVVENNILYSHPVTSIYTGASEQRTENGFMLLLESKFTDGKTLKNFFSFLNKLHSEILLEFYSGGIISVIRKIPDDTINTSGVMPAGTSYSMLKISSNNLLQYTLHKDALSVLYNNEKREENLFFSLRIQTRDMTSFLDTIKASTAVSLSYSHCMDKSKKNAIKFRNDDNGAETLIDVIFEGKTKNDLPLFDNITSDNICPFIKIPIDRFTETISHMTKLKSQCHNHIMIDLYHGQKIRKVHIHSEKEKFFLKYPTGEISRHDSLHVEPLMHGIDPKFLKILALLTKFNARGFVELYSHNKILRISTHISHFGEYSVYIISH